MASESDTLNIGSLRLKKEYPIAETQAAAAPLQPAIHPEAAEAARAKIAALTQPDPNLYPDKIPAAPTADLILDRNVLAQQALKTEPIAHRKLPTAVAPMLTAIGLFAITLLLFKAPVILSQISYGLSGSKKAAVTETNTPGTIIPAENTISIPKINIHAPVIFENSVVEEDVQKALQSGVVHYGNTALPGQAGNSAIFGHSSNDWWEPGNYKFVFVLLDKLIPGDRFTMDYQSKRYTYEVTGSKIVEPTDISVLKPTAEPTLTLITCTPPGTSLRRLVVTAKQVDPAPNQASVAATAATSSSPNLPSSPPGFLDQIGQAWNGVWHGFTSLFGGDKDNDKSSSGTQSNDQIPAAK